jgi:hypothetical protein
MSKRESFITSVLLITGLLGDINDPDIWLTELLQSLPTATDT